MSPPQKSDEQQKAAARGSRASRPGAQTVSSAEAAKFDQRIAEKRNESTMCAPRELQSMEQDLEAKQKGRSVLNEPAKPGAYSQANSMARTELETLESDVVAKNRARRQPGAEAVALDSKVAAKMRGETAVNEQLSSLESAVQAKMKQQPGAQVESLDMKVAAKTRGETAVNNELRSLEDAVHAKMRSSGGQTSSSNSSPGARTSLNDFEDAVMAKNHRAHSEISRLDERIATKNAAAGYSNSAAASLPTPQSLQEAEETVLKKKQASNGPSGLSPDRDPLEQNPNGLSKSDGRELSNDGLLPHAGVASDVEYGEYGGVNEEGLAVAFAVEEDDDDMYIPSAVEYDPDAKPPMYRNRRFRLYAFLAIVVVIVATIGAAVGITLSQEEVPEIPYRETLGIRENVEKVVGADALEDLGSPYRMALDWIIHKDPQQQTPDNPSFLQRYFAAYMYYATSEKQPWHSCAPAKEGEDSDCIYLELLDSSALDYIEVPWKRWLSDLSECAWAGVYCNDREQIRAIELAGMNMTGSFPEGIISGFPYLQALLLASGQLRGTLPSGIGSMKHLLSFEIVEQQLSGSIPEDIYKSVSLQRINLGTNRLSGSISSSIGNMRDLKALYLMRNQLSGSLPKEIDGLQSFTFVRVSDNRLNGTIPESMGNLTTTMEIHLQNNNFTGRIPSSLGNLALLQDLRMGGNLLTGPIPDTLYDMTSLAVLELYGNKLSGTISPLISQLKYLFSARFESNNFNGTLPVEMGNLTDLSLLTLYENGFGGSVPETLCTVRYENPLQFKKLQADCGPDSSGIIEIACPNGCCTDCCDPTGQQCFPLIQD